MINLKFRKLDRVLKGKIIILGIGNKLKGDDGAGSILISRIKGKTKVNLFDCEEVPENYTQPIIEARPDNIVMVDAADWNGLAGAIRFINMEEINNISFSTHDSSLKIFIDYLKKHLPNTHIIIIGIQPKRSGFLDSLSPEVEKTVAELSQFLEKI